MFIKAKKKFKIIRKIVCGKALAKNITQRALLLNARLKNFNSYLVNKKKIKRILFIGLKRKEKKKDFTNAQTEYALRVLNRSKKFNKNKKKKLKTFHKVHSYLA